MWKHIIILGFIAALISSASATTVTNEKVEIDLENSRVHVELSIGDLTTRNFTYFTTYRISDVEVKSSGEELECRVDSSSIESEISCAINKTNSFNTSLNYTAEGLVTQEGARKVFDYTQNFPRPTNHYSIAVTLPRGEVIVDQQNVTQNVINPPDAEISTNGQRITVMWDVTPPNGETSILGETRTFRLLYESVEEESQNFLEPIIIGLIAISVLTALVLGARQFLRNSIDDIYDDLSEDQIELIELLRENDGAMLQKDIVESMNYSKAKISGIVKDLVEEEILEKEKEGRSNMLSISKKYRY